MKKTLLISLSVTVFLLGYAIVYAAVFESQPNILYSGVAAQTESFQRLGTGYTQLAGGVGVYLTSGSAVSTIYLQECSSSAYADCSSVADTGAFNITTVDGNQESSSTFSAAYQMTSGNYYRLRWTSASHRIQCGDTSASTPIATGDATPADACNAASARSWTFKLYEGASAATRRIVGRGMTR